MNVKSIQNLPASGFSGYSRLKRIFTAGQNYQNYDKIVSTAQNKLVGNIPAELIKIFAKDFPAEKGEKIKSVQQIFANLAADLNKGFTAEFKRLKSLEDSDFILAYVYDMDKILSDEHKNIVNIANQKLNNSLKKVLPNLDKVNLEPVGQGNFGICYKLSMFDKSGSKIIADRAFKVYKNQSEMLETHLFYLDRSLDIFEKYNNNEILNIIKSKTNKIIDERTFSKQIQMHRLSATHVPPIDFIKKRMNMNLQFHGVCAEANSAARLKYILGHNLSKTDFVPFDMFDLGHNFSITRFSDGFLPDTTSPINFDLLGMCANDQKLHNLVGGKYIEFGGIELERPSLGDHTVLKYFKKIKNRMNFKERSIVVAQYKELIKNPKTPLREKIKLAIMLALKS